MDTSKRTIQQPSNPVQLTAEQYLEELERRLATALRRILAEVNRNKEVVQKKKEPDGSGN